MKKIIWKNEKTSNNWKINNIEDLKKLNWQLKAFEESYKSKLKQVSH